MWISLSHRSALSTSQCLCPFLKQPSKQLIRPVDTVAALKLWNVLHAMSFTISLLLWLVKSLSLSQSYWHFTWWTPPIITQRTHQLSGFHGCSSAVFCVTSFVFPKALCLHPQVNLHHLCGYPLTHPPPTLKAAVCSDHNWVLHPHREPGTPVDGNH